MLLRRTASCAFAVAAISFAARAAHAISVDGKLDAGYTQLSVQTTKTSPGPDATTGQPDFSVGSELDGAWAAVDQGMLYLFFAGNLMDTVCGFQACTQADALEIFIDSQPGGQNQLLGDSPAGFPLAGLTFDSGFVPDYLLEFFAAGALDHAFTRNAYYGSLPTGGGGSAIYLGSGTNPGAPATLSGGTNPFGILATIDNENTAGVSAGCGPASGAGVTTGVELAIPLAAIGNPAGCFTVSAFILEPPYAVTNQAAGPLPPGTCFLGPAPGVNFASIPGDQFLTVCPAATSARRATWGRLKAIYR